MTEMQPKQKRETAAEAIRNLLADLEWAQKYGKQG